MPKITEIVKQKLDRLESVPNRFVGEVKKSQLEAYQEIQNLVLKMDTESGILIISDKNTAIINSIESTIKDAVFNDEYSKSLTQYIKEFNIQGQLANKYFVELDVGFGNDNKIDTILGSQKNALSVLGEDSFTQSFISPLNQLLSSSITSGASMSTTLDSLRDFALGNNDVDGKMVSYVKRIAYDAFTVSDRTYTNAVSNSLGLEFFIYRGGEISDTRDFCAERNGKYYHKNEIEGWGDGKKCCGLSWPRSGEWQGRNSLTNKTTIFTLAGGYNCKHSIDPVSIRSVPKDVINRNIENGNYKP